MSAKLSLANYHHHFSPYLLYNWCLVRTTCQSTEKMAHYYFLLWFNLRYCQDHVNGIDSQKSCIYFKSYPLGIHGISGLAEVLLMLFHAVWATIVVIKQNPEQFKKFHKFSISVWSIGLIPYLVVMVIGMLHQQIVSLCQLEDLSLNSDVIIDTNLIQHLQCIIKVKLSDP